MAGNKYLELSAGRLKERAGTQSSGGAGDANKLVALDSAGRLDQSVMPTGIGADTRTITTSEALSAGDFINVHDSTGVKVRKADATAEGKEAAGFVLSAASSGASALVYFEGTVTGLTGLTIGARYYLATTAGGVTATPPSGVGNVVQYLGVAVSATEISFEPGDPVTVG
jgi:hypothetical protein